MSRYVFGAVFLFTSLQADIPAENLSSIYTEAIIFIAVFGVMSVVSYIVSTKHAREHAIENRAKIDEERLKAKENVSNKKSRFKELSKMQESGLLKEDELNVLKKWIYHDE